MANISVIVPIYNVEAYLSRCIDSILRQSYPDFELILVDDGSPDNCGAICDEYAMLDSRVHVIHQKNGGLSAARNTGIDWAFSHSDSQWVTFIDSDDWVHPNYLRILLNAAITHNCKIARCNYKESFSYSPPDDIDDCGYSVVVLDSFEGYDVSACMKLFDKKCFQNARFPVGKLHEDAFIIYKIFFIVSQVAFVDIPLYCYFINNDSITRSVWTPRRMDEFQAYEEQMNFFHNHNAEKHYRKAAIQLLWSYIFQIRALQHQKSVSGRLYYIAFMRRKMRQLIRRNHTRIGVSRKATPKIYEYSYPICSWFLSKLTNIYWFFVSVKNKVGHLLHR